MGLLYVIAFYFYSSKNLNWINCWVFHHNSLCVLNETFDVEVSGVSHDDVIKWKHFPRNWPFVRGIHRSPVNSPHKGQWRGALMFTLICARINGWVNTHEAGDLRRYRPHYDFIVMCKKYCLYGLYVHFGCFLIPSLQPLIIATWWRHQMETFSALLAICAGNSPVPGEFPTQRPVTRGFDVYFDLRPNKRLSKQSLGWWFETLSPPLWRHRNDWYMLPHKHLVLSNSYFPR